MVFETWLKASLQERAAQFQCDTDAFVDCFVLLEARVTFG
jgi:hypothetical protein